MTVKLNSEDDASTGWPLIVRLKSVLSSVEICVPVFSSQVRPRAVLPLIESLVPVPVSVYAPPPVPLNWGPKLKRCEVRVRALRKTDSFWLW